MLAESAHNRDTLNSMPPNFGDFRRKIEEKEMKNVSFCDTRQKEHGSENLIGKLACWEKNLPLDLKLELTKL